MASKQTIKFEVEGLKEALKMLENLPKDVNDRVLLDINKQAAKIVKEELMNSAPDGDNSKSAEDKIENNILIKTEKGSKTNALIGFAKKVFFVKFLEMGVQVMRKKDSGAKTGTLPRQPFVEAAHNRAYPKVIEFVTQNALQIINKSLKRQAKKFKSK
jgi:HK97 gp10 family phage protein